MPTITAEEFARDPFGYMNRMMAGEEIAVQEGVTVVPAPAEPPAEAPKAVDDAPPDETAPVG